MAKVKIKIINTRPAEQSAALTELLKEAGLESVEVPLIMIVPFKGSAAASLKSEKYNGLFFSSINGMKIFFNFFQNLLTFPVNFGLITAHLFRM